MRVAFIVNPASANGKTGIRFEKLKPVINEYFAGCEYFYTKKMGDASKIAKKLALNHYDRVIGVGGDGTFNEIVNGLVEDGKALSPHTVFGTLPMGTGGDLVRTLKISHNPQKALEQLKENKVIDADVGQVQLKSFEDKPIVKYFLNQFSFGLGGLTCLKVNGESKALGGTFSFFKGAIKAILSFPFSKVAIKFKGCKNKYEGAIQNVAIANGQFSGGGMNMAPGARLDTGDFKMIIFEWVPKYKLLFHMPKIYWGGHMKLPTTKVKQITEIEADKIGEQDIFLELDGETPGKLPLKAKCLKSAIKINVGQTYH